MHNENKGTYIYDLSSVIVNRENKSFNSLDVHSGSDWMLLCRIAGVC